MIPVAIFLFLVGAVLSARYHDPVELRPLRLGASLYVLPALRPLVEDLFLVRSPARAAESAKEQEAQREVLLATLLKVASVSRTLDLLTVVIASARRESGVVKASTEP